MISTTTDYWIHSLKKVNHHEPLIQLIQLSQRIKLKIELLEQMSPTKTCCNDGIINNYLEKPLPSFDSAVDLHSTCYPTNKPLPSIHYDNKLQHIPITHTKKKYIGIKGLLLKRKYQIENTIVTKSILSYYFVKLLSSFDKSTGEKKAVLKIYITTTHHNLYIIPYYHFTFYHSLESKTKSQKFTDRQLLQNTTDNQIQSALFIWLSYYHHQLPLLEDITDILRQELVIYIVYRVQ